MFLRAYRRTKDGSLIPTTLWWESSGRSAARAQRIMARSASFSPDDGDAGGVRPSFIPARSPAGSCPFRGMMSMLLARDPDVGSHSPGQGRLDQRPLLRDVWLGFSSGGWWVGGDRGSSSAGRAGDSPTGGRVQPSRSSRGWWRVHQRRAGTSEFALAGVRIRLVAELEELLVSRMPW